MGAESLDWQIKNKETAINMWLPKRFHFILFGKTVTKFKTTKWLFWSFPHTGPWFVTISILHNLSFTVKGPLSADIAH